MIYGPVVHRVTYVFIGKPSWWKLLFSKIAGLQSTPAILLKIDPTTTEFYRMIFSRYSAR